MCSFIESTIAFFFLSEVPIKLQRLDDVTL